MMFYRSSTALGPSVTAIQQHLGAVEKELEKIGYIARRRGSAAVSQASDRISGTVSSVLGNMLDRLNFGGQAVRERASSLGNRAINVSADYGKGVLADISAQFDESPLITLSVAVGIGVLIGAAVLGSVNNLNGETTVRHGRKHKRSH